MMTLKQKFQACVALAPNFRVTIEFVELPSSERVMAWRGRKTNETEERSAGVAFPPGGDFEATFSFLLSQALMTLLGS